MKKYLAVILSLMLVFSLTVSASAKTQYYETDYPVIKTVLKDSKVTIKYISDMIVYTTSKGKQKKCPKLNIYGYNKNGKWELLKTATNDGSVKANIKNLAKDGKVGKKTYKNTYVLKILGADKNGKSIGVNYYIYVKH